MDRITSLIDEAEFHANGLRTIVSLISIDPRHDSEIVRTLSYALGAVVERRKILTSLVDPTKAE